MNITENSTMSLSSPDINNNGMYMDDLECSWTIVTADNNVLRLQFSNFQLDDQSAACPDYVEVSISNSSTFLSACLKVEGIIIQVK